MRLGGLRGWRWFISSQSEGNRLKLPPGWRGLGAKTEQAPGDYPEACFWSSAEA